MLRAEISIVLIVALVSLSSASSIDAIQLCSAYPVANAMAKHQGEPQPSYIKKAIDSNTWPSMNGPIFSTSQYSYPDNTLPQLACSVSQFGMNLAISQTTVFAFDSQTGEYLWELGYNPITFYGSPGLVAMLNDHSSSLSIINTVSSNITSITISRSGPSLMTNVNIAPDYSFGNTSLATVATDSQLWLHSYDTSICVDVSLRKVVSMTAAPFSPYGSFGTGLIFSQFIDSDQSLRTFAFRQTYYQLQECAPMWEIDTMSLAILSNASLSEASSVCADSYVQLAGAHLVSNPSSSSASDVVLAVFQSSFCGVWAARFSLSKPTSSAFVPHNTPLLSLNGNIAFPPACIKEYYPSVFLSATDNQLLYIAASHLSCPQPFANLLAVDWTPEYGIQAINQPMEWVFLNSTAPIPVWALSSSANAIINTNGIGNSASASAMFVFAGSGSVMATEIISFPSS